MASMAVAISNNVGVLGQAFSHSKWMIPTIVGARIPTSVTTRKTLSTPTSRSLHL